MTEPVFALKNVNKVFQVSRGLFARPRPLHALRDVNLVVNLGETVGLVGESGCGKSTVARILLGLLGPTSGDVFIGGRPIADVPRRELVRQVQPVFQDPYSSLNPCRTIAQTVEQPLRIHRIGGDRAAEVRRMLDMVGFPQRLADSYPSELSGGQRQRVAIARALILKPRVLICDEPTSALDVSVQAQVINLLLDLREAFGLTMVFISHNLAVVEHLADRVAVMYLGQVVEEADAAALFESPAHPYTQALFASTLSPTPGRGVPEVQLGNAPADPLAIDAGCAFAPRCPIVVQICTREAPELLDKRPGRVRCHLAGQDV